jgi:hypothetical protein
MAKYLLSNSPTYMSKTDPAVIRRREVVCRHLNDRYRITKRMGKNLDKEELKRIQEELAEEGIGISYGIYQQDKKFIRIFHELQMEANDTKREKKIAEANESVIGRKAIRYLFTDDHSVAHIQRSSSAAESLPLKTEVVAEEVVATGRGPAERLQELMFDATSIMNQLLKENEELHSENSSLADYVAFVDQYNANLEDQLRSAMDGIKSVHGSTLDEIARQNPGFPQLTVIAQQLKERQARRKQEMDELLNSLPKEFSWNSDVGNIIYQDHFLKALVEIQKNERAQVVKQLHILSREGPEYGSLNTKKTIQRLPYSPQGCFASRGSDEWRFTWLKNCDLTVYYLYRKSDTRIHQAER